MKRFALVSLLLVALTVAPFANASCTGYFCGVGNCPWYQLIIDEGFASPSCNAWNYTGTGGVGFGSVCNGQAEA